MTRAGPRPSPSQSALFSAEPETQDRKSSSASLTRDCPGRTQAAPGRGSVVAAGARGRLSDSVGVRVTWHGDSDHESSLVSRRRSLAGRAAAELRVPGLPATRLGPDPGPTSTTEY